jgi:hypothetical protein
MAIHVQDIAFGGHVPYSGDLDESDVLRIAGVLVVNDVDPFIDFRNEDELILEVHFAGLLEGTGILTFDGLSEFLESHVHRLISIIGLFFGAFVLNTAGETHSEEEEQA